MNKAELTEVLAARLGSSRNAAGDWLDAMLEEIQREVAKGSKVSLTGFGVFEKRNRQARTARNPRTGEAVKVKKTSVPAFRPGQGFKDVVTGSKKITKSTATKAVKKAAKSTKAAVKTATKATAKVAKKAAAKKSTVKKTSSKR